MREHHYSLMMKTWFRNQGAKKKKKKVSVKKKKKMTFTRSALSDIGQSLNDCNCI